MKRRFDIESLFGYSIYLQKVPGREEFTAAGNSRREIIE
jgi:hypothetical protein